MIDKENVLTLEKIQELFNQYAYLHIESWIESLPKDCIIYRFDASLPTINGFSKAKYRAFMIFDKDMKGLGYITEDINGIFKLEKWKKENTNLTDSV